MRILFAGSPAIAVPCLERLIVEGKKSGNPVVGVLTNPDTAKGRHGAALPTEVASAAEVFAQGPGALAIVKMEKLNAEARKAVATLKADILVSFAYGHIFGPKFLALFPKGGINIHPSLLPKYRGATPIPSAILAQERETGISIQRLALDMDAGDLLVQDRFALDPRSTTMSLSAQVADRAAELLVEVLRDISAGTEKTWKQDAGLATYCSQIQKEDGRIDWKESSASIDAQIRAYTPWPLSFTSLNGQILFILEAEPYEGSFIAPEPSSKEPGFVLGIDKGAGILVQTGEGLLALKRLQFSSKKALDWRSFLNGARDFIGNKLDVSTGGK
ncbi:methionyl-tRNA formyltransferase [Treponema sp.]